MVMMIYRPAGLIPAARRKRELKRDEVDSLAAATHGGGDLFDSEIHDMDNPGPGSGGS